ncbi:MAG: hypothetical protein BGO70_05750 [Bacteroidetes bacterium 43-93]|nr:cadmium-translocating P-type ATPase [Bacteroidota bacterium]OJW96902.1 MAG: hypothetical protein BGO70_05750 [Bacteroidetes bacterium 43-93]
MQKTYSTVVEGMTCGNCAITISKLLEKKGATNISANAASGEVSFSVPEEADVEKVYDSIDGLGYKVVRGEEDIASHASHASHDHDHSARYLLISALLTVPLLAHMFTNWYVLHLPWVQFAFATPVYIMGIMVFGKSAVRSLQNRVPNMDVLIMLGATAAYIYSLIGLLFYKDQAMDYLFFETTASIITLVMLGNWIEHKTVTSTTVAINELVKLQPQTARIVMTDSVGKESVMTVESKYVRTGDIVLVNNGDSVPVDGEIIYGDAQLDEHMITGESMPVRKQVGNTVVGGTLVVDGNLKVKATTIGNASVLSNIIKMVREAQGTKPQLQKLADKISAIFVPTVLVIAVATLLGNYFFVHLSFAESMMRSIAVMVISCPCAMGLATPAAVAVGLGRAARNGILIKGGDTLERLKTIKQIVFDKTGTLTTGKLQIESLVIADKNMQEDQLRSLIASIEAHSSHPIARSINAQWKSNHPVIFRETTEVKGKGIEAVDEAGVQWQLGSGKWLHENAAVDKGYDVYLYKNGTYTAALKISDAIRKDAKDTVAKLKQMGYKTILLSGDSEEKCRYVAESLGIQDVFAGYNPEQKNKKLDELMRAAPTAMVGDGINDAPALAKATVGISLSESTQIAIQSANIILSGNKLSVLPKAIRLGIYTDQTIKQNLFWAFIYNIIAIPVAAIGLLRPTYGAGIMALSDVVLILNSLLLGVRKLDK